MRKCSKCFEEKPRVFTGETMETLEESEYCKECLFDMLGNPTPSSIIAVPLDEESEKNQKKEWHKKKLDSFKNDLVKITAACKASSMEMMMEHVARHIKDNNTRIRDHFMMAYIEEMIDIEEEFCIDDLCLVEQEPHIRDGRLTRRYWFEYRTKFTEEDD